MSAKALVTVENLWRRYGSLVAVRDLSFSLYAGDVLGFLGPNGAGKSTSMQMLSGNLAPSAGSIFINGTDLLDNPDEAKAALGYLPEQPPVYPEFSVREYLNFCARLNRIPRCNIPAAVERALERCSLGHVAERLIGNLSKGYQQRVGIAQAIIHEPAVVILDEPTVGLDPIQILEIRALIRELGRDHTVILSTHILPEVQSVCSRVLIVDQGRAVYSDTLANLNAGMTANSLVVGAVRLPKPEALAALPGVEKVEAVDPLRARLLHDGRPDIAAAVAERAVAEGWGLTELMPERKTLEQVFVELTSGETAAVDPHANKEEAA